MRPRRSDNQNSVERERDVVMPGLNGFQATRAIAHEERTKHIPIIICSTKDQETDKIWGLRQGAKDYLVKPLNETELLAKIGALAQSGQAAQPSLRAQ